MRDKETKRLCEAMAKLSGAAFDALEWEEIKGVKCEQKLKEQLIGATILNIESVNLDRKTGEFDGVILFVQTPDEEFKAYEIGYNEDDETEDMPPVMAVSAASIDKDTVNKYLSEE